MKLTIDVKTLRGWIEQGRPVTVLDIRGIADHANESIPASIHSDGDQALKAGYPDARAVWTCPPLSPS
jgi:hypothetical protein